MEPPIRIHGAKLYGHGIEYYTIVFDRDSMMICRLAEKMALRRHRYSTKIDEMVIRVKIERGDYGTCETIPYTDIKLIDYKVTKENILIEIKISDGRHLIFHIHPRKKKLIQRGVNYVKRVIKLK